MTTRSYDTTIVISDKETAKRFAKGYRESINREREELPDVLKLLEEGRKYLESGALD